MIQPSLLEYDARAHARASDPITSHESAEAHESVNGHHCRVILEVLRQRGVPMAAEEIANHVRFTSPWLNLDKVAINKRFADLLARGAIERTEIRHVNRSGRSALKVRLA